MSMEKQNLKKSELHVHFWGCFYPEDLYEIGKDYYKEIDWNRFDFLEGYEEIYGVKLYPVKMFEEAEKTGSLDKIEEVAVFRADEGGDFSRFSIKTFFAIAITGYFLDNGMHQPILAPIVNRHKAEGLKYVEYRYSFGSSIFDEWHTRFGNFLKESSTDDFIAKAVIRLYDDTTYYDKLRDFLARNPDLVDTIVGVDFSGREVAPKKREKFFKKLDRDNRENPAQALDAVVHVGENFFDKSIESAIRWCHQYAELGAARLGHCIALGLDPEVAISRRPDAHLKEAIAERLDQISYDLKYQDQLQEYGIDINREALLKEKDELVDRDPEGKVCREYNDNRLQDIRKRQNFVLDRLKELGTVIETCPTSNLRIGGIPELKYHPFKKFYDSGVNLVICSDDPGVFDMPLADEVDLIQEGFGIDPKELYQRLGDPYDYRLGKTREMAQDSKLS